ncbi:hypothetical protein ACFWQC_07370 [Nocardioides sp. NPDC058538]|uniref:hypothetical protein n=1 Tax=Nocardioides sp. NPDC058538 TaxID=3346542 RepID=UPI00365D1D05
MNPLAAIGGIVGFGVAGLDPFGALVVVPALATGARRRVVLLFFGTAWLTTVLTGIALGESVQHVVAWLRNLLSVPDPVRLTVQLVTAIGLGLWAAHRWAHRNDARPEKTKKSMLAGPTGMSLMGVFWGVSALTDPSFYGVATIGASMPSLLAGAAVFSGWFLISQAPLCLVVLTLAAGKDSRPVQRAVALARRTARPASYVMTALLATASLFLVASAAAYLATGTYWPA